MVENEEKIIKKREGSELRGKMLICGKFCSDEGPWTFEAKTGA